MSGRILVIAGPTASGKTGLAVELALRRGGEVVSADSMGTALNKVLKDFINRYKSMTGYLTPYVPGWDNHGM